MAWDKWSKLPDSQDKPLGLHIPALVYHLRLFYPYATKNSDFSINYAAGHLRCPAAVLLV